MKIVDTHAHLYFSQFDKDRDLSVKNAEKSGVKFQIQIGCDEISSLAALNLSKNYKNFYSTLGLHPSEVLNIGKKTKFHKYQDFENYLPKAKNLDELIEIFEKIYLENKEKIVGFGETGFDFYHHKKSEIFELQKKSFRAHLELSKKYNLALIIHTRSARNETLEFLNQNFTQKIKGVCHCFCEDLEFAKMITEKLGLFLGIGGVATYKNSQNIREVIKKIPLEFLVTETDCPFLVPQNFSKKGIKRNEPKFLSEIIKLIAQEKNIQLEACADILFKNSKKLFVTI